MDLSSLPQIKTKTAKRLGRGHSSGKGKTSGRGQKGQKARGKVRLGFEGGQTPLYKKVPFLRGKGNKKWSPKFVGVNLSELKDLTSGTTVTKQVLLEQKIITKQEAQKGVKILGNGELASALTFAVPVSQKARQKIGQAKGTIIEEAA